jgi:ribose 5-phosphate isomerase B
MKKIAIGCDHAGYKMKEDIVAHLRSKNIEIMDMGAFSEESVDYPDFAHLVAKAVTGRDVEFGILLCGSGNGISMAANKHAGIRAALCWTPEIATLARMHNNANVLSLPARFITENTAIETVDAFLETPFEGGRHERRVEKIPF